MGTHTVANETIWPSQNDIAQTTGNGNKLLENQWAKPMTALWPNNYTLSGLTVPATSASLNIDVASGAALIAGRHVTVPSATTITAAASNTNYVFLKLTRDGSSLGTGVSLDVNITGTPPADSILLATLTAGASTITATVDKRTLPQRIEALTAGTTWTAPAGITLIYAEVFGASGGGGGGGGVGGTNGPAGSAGGAGGATSFDVLSATGGGGGYAGRGQSSAGGATGGAHGTGSGGQINFTGLGRTGGTEGNGAFSNAGAGGMGGTGGYASKWMTVVPGTDYAYAIGSAGTAGAGGIGTGSGAITGGAGNVGLAGVVIIHY